MTFYMLLFSAITMGMFAKPWQHIELFTKSSFLFWAILNSISTGLIATLSGVFLLSEQINLVGFFGIVIMLVSIVLMNITIPKKEKEVAVIEDEAIESCETQ